VEPGCRLNRKSAGCCRGRLYRLSIVLVRHGRRCIHRCARSCVWMSFGQREKILGVYRPRLHLAGRLKRLVHSSQLSSVKEFQMHTLRRPIFHLIKSHRNTIPPGFNRMASTHAATIRSLDHVVLTVKSISRTTEWYTQNLGMRAESFVSAASPDITRHSLIFGQQKINLHQLGKVHHLLLNPLLKEHLHGK
jgi:hypothetical protein